MSIFALATRTPPSTPSPHPPIASVCRAKALLLGRGTNPNQDEVQPTGSWPSQLALRSSAPRRATLCHVAVFCSFAPAWFIKVFDGSDKINKARSERRQNTPTAHAGDYAYAAAKKKRVATFCLLKFSNAIINICGNIRQSFKRDAWYPPFFASPFVFAFPFQRLYHSLNE